MKKIYSQLFFASVIFCGFTNAQDQNFVSFSSVVEKMKIDGVSQEQISMFLNRQYHRNGRTIPKPTASCDNGLESGFSGWTGYIGNTNGTLNPTWTQTVIATPNHKIVSYNDIEQCGNIFTSIPLPAPNFGDSTARMGDPKVAGCVTERLTYSFTVNASDTSFLFTYATIIQDAGHAVQDQPFFHVMLIDQNGDTVPNSYYYYIGGPNPPGFDTTNCSFGTWFKKWTLRGVSLMPYVGQQVTFVATNADCNDCGHFAHSYIDFDCDGNLFSPRYCPGGPVTLNAHSEPGSTYLWEGGSTAEALTISSPNMGDTISCMVTPWGGYTFKVNYVLTPALASFTSTVNTNTVTFTNSSPGAISCQWDFGDGNNSSACNPSHVYSSPGTYTVCLTVQTDGCSGVTSCTSVTILATSIDENSLDGFSLSPNPTSSKINIKPGAKLKEQQISVSVINLVGTEIMIRSFDPGKEKMEMDLSALSSGIYFVKMKLGSSEVTRKLILLKE